MFKGPMQTKCMALLAPELLFSHERRLKKRKKCWKTFKFPATRGVLQTSLIKILGTSALTFNCILALKGYNQSKQKAPLQSPSHVSGWWLGSAAANRTNTILWRLRDSARKWLGYPHCFPRFSEYLDCLLEACDEICIVVISTKQFFSETNLYFFIMIPLNRVSNKVLKVRYTQNFSTVKQIARLQTQGWEAWLSLKKTVAGVKTLIFHWKAGHVAR